MQLLDALEMVRQAGAGDGQHLKVFLASGFTPLHVQTYLGAHLKLRFPDRRPLIEPGLYGDCLIALQGLDCSEYEAGLVVIEWPDLDPRLGLRRITGWLPGDLPDVLDTAEAAVQRLQQRISAIARTVPVAVSLPTLPIPPVSYTPRWQAGSFELKLEGLAGSLGQALAAVANVRVISRQLLDSRSPAATRFDVKSALSYDFPYSLGHTDALAETLVAAAFPAQPIKGIITDLDNTLWRGVIGDVGVDGVSWDLDHRSQSHALYQQLLRSLAESGVLIAIASKNTPQFAEEGLRRQDFHLPLDCLFPIQIGWNPKPEAVSRILEQWRISADCVIFIDDSPIELAEVESAHPGIQTRCFPTNDDQAAYSLLEELRTLCGRSSVTDEDLLRRESLRTGAELNSGAMAGEYDPEEFLKRLNPELSVSYSKDPLDPRALELVNKTNQFNLNGRRYTQGEWQTYLKQWNTMLQVASYCDKFGALGKIAVMAGRQVERRLYLDCWVMSCRAFSRRIEYRCLQLMFEELGVDEIVFDYAETERNGPLQSSLKVLLNCELSEGPVLTRKAFEANCPPLYFSS